MAWHYTESDMWVDTNDDEWVEEVREDYEVMSIRNTIEYNTNNIIVPRELPFAAKEWALPIHRTLDTEGTLRDLQIVVNTMELATIKFSVYNPNFITLVPRQAVQLKFPNKLDYIVMVTQVTIDQSTNDITTIHIEGFVVAICGEDDKEIKEEFNLLGRKLRL